MGEAGADPRGCHQFLEDVGCGGLQYVEDVQRVYMAKVRLEIVPWLTRAFGKQGLGRLVLEHEIEDGEILGRLLRDLAVQYEEFGEVAFDKSLKKSSGVVNVGLNNRIIEWEQEWTIQVRDGDTVIIMPAYVGG